MGMNKQMMVLLYPYTKMSLGKKKNELLIHATTWMNLKIIMLKEARKKDSMYDVVYIKF